METYISISQLNDFIFCPRSIYYHQLYQNYNTICYHSRYQIEGQAAHKSVDQKTYSTRKEIIQGLPVYCEKFCLGGKIDLYNTRTKVLTERKKKVIRVYDGYVYQVYAQYYALIEMGYKVEMIKIYSMDDNKSYPIPLPDQDSERRERFFQLIEEMNRFDLNQAKPVSPEKCQNCIYHELCDQPC